MKIARLFRLNKRQRVRHQKDQKHQKQRIIIVRVNLLINRLQKGRLTNRLQKGRLINRLKRMPIQNRLVKIMNRRIRTKMKKNSR